MDEIINTAPAVTTPTAPEQTPSSEAVENIVPSDVEQGATPEDSPTPDPVDSADDAEPKRNRAEERIHDLVAERNAAKEYAEFWRDKAMEVVRSSRPAAQQTPQPHAPEPPPLPPTPPTLQDFGFDQAKWAQATAEWTNRQVEARVAESLARREAARGQQEIVESFEKQAEEFRKDNPDFDIVLANPRLPQLDRVAAAMILSSDKAAAVSYHLAKNPELATRISRMSSPQQALAIGRLEAELRNAPAKKAPAAVPPAPKVTSSTRAPAPPQPVPSGGVADTDMSQASIDDWMRMRVTESRSKRRGGRLA